MIGTIKGIKKTDYGNVDQILIAPDLSFAMSCVVSNSLGVAVGSRKVVKAGMPLTGTLGTATAMTEGSESNAVGILQHDVDVTDGDNNGSVLIFGFVNMNRIDETTRGKLTTNVQNKLNKITFVSV